MAIAPKSIPPVMVVAIPVAEERPESRQRQGRPRQIETPADIRWPVVQEFLRASNLAANSRKLYERELKRFLGWTHSAWSELKLRQLGQYKAYLMEHEVKPGKTLSKSSVNAALTALKSFFRWLNTFHPELCPENPTEGVKFERLPVPMPQDISAENMEKVWAAVVQRGRTQVRDLALLHLLASGMRSGEVVATNVGSFDGRLISIPISKNKQPRLVPLSPAGQKAVAEYLDWRRDQGEELQPDFPLFLSQHRGWGGQRLSYQGVYQMVEAIGEISGVPDIHPHRLRHTGASEMLRKGMDPAHAMRLTGHTDERSFRRYTMGAEQEAAVEAYYRSIEESKELVYAKSLDRKQRKLLGGLVQLTGKEPLGQVEFDDGDITFAELWQENIEALEQMLELAYGMPEMFGVKVAEEGQSPDIQSQEREEVNSPETALVDLESGLKLQMPLRYGDTAVEHQAQVRFKLWVEGRKKSKVRKEIERQVFSDVQGQKTKPRGNEYLLTLTYHEKDEISQIIGDMFWRMEMIAELDNCKVNCEWEMVDQVLELASTEEPLDCPKITAVEDSLDAVHVTSVYQLKITLLGVQPKVWRRLQVSEVMTLAQLHPVVQAAMGWEGYHLHKFSVNEDEEDETLTLAELIGNELFSFSYLYNLGDMWQHEIEVEKRLASEPEKTYPVCLAGKQACPPEDCGGDWGYAHLLKVLKNPRHSDHRERKEWVGSEFDPKAFDLQEVNQALRELEYS
ncbi:Tyrosine recombinase XerC [Acaryochloris thomasi RCC1774]|uniref:Tyrosine recombinase XerC n=1 Tax=Acaryochloris thomasi RCC1774 TaxID=1764569 RepID=A0A2W1J996_9CYAN|nr:tyrosine-type recombinase/integrase [Acaryochloris thomasi]PZD70820.1 Tyrosine recombinase XerC [Acaryochloris thomasi RCC1774]